MLKIVIQYLNLHKLNNINVNKFNLNNNLSDVNNKTDLELYSFINNIKFRICLHMLRYYYRCK